MKVFGRYDTEALKKHYGKKIRELEEEKRIVQEERDCFLAEIDRLAACDVPSVVQKNHTQKLEALEVQLLEAAWCLTNIAAGKREETKDLLPALPLLVAHLGEKSSLPVAEQCAWALGNVAGEGVELRNVLLAQGALPPLARMMLPDKGSAVRTAAWALSNLIKG